MAKIRPIHNFGAKAKRPKKPRKGSGKKSNAWRSYVGGGGRGPIPD